MDWDWNYTLSILPNLGRGVIVTIQATALAACLAMALGLLWAVVRRSAAPIPGYMVKQSVMFIRGTPLLVQLYFLFYVLADVGVVLSPLTAGVIGLGLHYSSYTSEVYRAGIEAVPKAQWEAAKACNLNTFQTWRYIVLPQALRPMIPAFGNYLVAMFKETPLLSAIAVAELMTEARGVANASYRYLEPMTMVGVFFILINIPAVIWLRWLERRSSSE